MCVQIDNPPTITVTSVHKTYKCSILLRFRNVTTKHSLLNVFESGYIFVCQVLISVMFLSCKLHRSIINQIKYV